MYLKGTEQKNTDVPISAIKICLKEALMNSLIILRWLIQAGNTYWFIKR